MRITENYESHTKDELLNEASLRGLSDVKSAMPKADIVAAMELSDGEDAEKEAPEGGSSLIPVVLAEDIPVIRVPGTPPPDSKYNKGIWRNVNDGEKYALAILDEEDSKDGKTHFLKNTLHFWEGTKSQFRETFEKL